MSTDTTLDVTPAPAKDETTFAVTVTSPEPNPVVGTVTFYVDGVPVRTTPVDPAGVAAVLYEFPTKGTHTVHAEFTPGDARDTSSATWTGGIGGRAAAADAAPVTPVPYSSVATVNATVSGDAKGGTPTGEVAFRAGGDVVAVAAVAADGTVSATIGGLAAGTHTVEVAYSGDIVYDADVITADVEVTKADAKVEVLPPDTITVGAPATLRAKVSFADIGPLSAASSIPHPTGTVTFYADGTEVGTTALVDGVATLTHTFTAAGSFTLAASYSGDGNVHAVGVGASNVAAADVAPAADGDTDAPTSDGEGPVAGDGRGAGPGRSEGTGRHSGPSGDLARTGAAVGVLVVVAAALVAVDAALAAPRRRED